MELQIYRVMEVEAAFILVIFVVTLAWSAFWGLVPPVAALFAQWYYMQKKGIDIVGDVAKMRKDAHAARNAVVKGSQNLDETIKKHVDAVLVPAVAEIKSDVAESLNANVTNMQRRLKKSVKQGLEEGAKELKNGNEDGLLGGMLKNILS